jgi:hypothetical protein
VSWPLSRRPERPHWCSSWSTDSWTHARQLVARFLARIGADAAAIAGLDNARTLLLTNENSSKPVPPPAANCVSPSSNRPNHRSHLPRPSTFIRPTNRPFTSINRPCRPEFGPSAALSPAHPHRPSTPSPRTHSLGAAGIRPYSRGRTRATRETTGGPDGWDCPCSCPPSSVRTTSSLAAQPPLSVPAGLGHQGREWNRTEPWRHADVR